MGYTVGISSGFFGAAKDEDIMGISKKITWGITQGVNFVQVDLESITEFKEPDLLAKVKRSKDAGIEFGMHGETNAYGSGNVFQLDSAIGVDYMRTHDRLIRSLEEAGKIGAKYYLLHSSETTPWLNLWREFQPTSLVDFWGRPLSVFLKENPKLTEWLFDAIDNEKLMELKPFHERNYIITPKDYEIMYKEDARKNEKQIDEKEIQKISKEKALEKLYNFVVSEEQHYGPERLAYYFIAKWMEINKDPLWKSIAGDGNIDDNKFRNNFNAWVPAVAAKYWWGHLNPKESKYPDPKPILKKYKLYLVIETPTGFSGGEDLGRFSRPSHMCHLAMNSGTEYFGLTIDFEHMLGNNIDPKIDISAFPHRGGEKVKVLHLGFPTPLHTAHKGLELGSDEQKYIYDRIWELRQKGFKDGWFLFERAKVEDIKNSILSLRMLKKFLEEDIPPNKLPLEFYGLKEEGPAIRMQELQIKQHALDPLKGMLTVPEHEHGVFSGAAQEKGKSKEWQSEEYR